MDPLTVSLLTLRSVGTLFALQGKPEISQTINAVLRAYQAGKNVDRHMAAIADRLEKGGTLEDWDDITDRINDEVTDFLDGDAGSEPPIEDDGPELL
jgi:hypothetical protein